MWKTETSLQSAFKDNLANRPFPRQLYAQVQSTSFWSRPSVLWQVPWQNWDIDPSATGTSKNAVCPTEDPHSGSVLEVWITSPATCNLLHSNDVSSTDPYLLWAINLSVKELLDFLDILFVFCERPHAAEKLVILFRSDYCVCPSPMEIRCKIHAWSWTISTEIWSKTCNIFIP